MEIWNDIPGYELMYQASNLGQIKALKRIVKTSRGIRTARERIIKQANSSGYKLVMLCRFGERNNELVHRLVALAFIPNTYNKPCVNHIDGNKQNNNIDNLEWCTYSENEKHSYSNLNKKQPLGEKAYQSKIFDSEAIELIQLNKMYGLNYTRTAKEFNVTFDAIHGTCSGKYRKHLHLLF